ncbi:MAG: T9SS type A sorting domain-containing protein, partial [Bacteroidales bacterium]|nr:T9SS type A sorting domain-containing protein [Bacteroidales bacterium]
EQSLNNVDFERIAAVMPDTTSFTLTGLNPNTIYYFRICGFHHISGNSLYSDTVITTTQDAEPVELIAWYKFDGNASDSSGNNYNGNVNGAILSSSILDQAYRFDGVDDFIHIPRWDPDGWRPLHSPIHGDHQAFTLVAWINPDVVMDKNNLIIADDSQWGDFFFGLQDKSIILAFIHNSVDGGNQRYSTITDESVVVNEETFSHIAVTYEPINKAVTIYLNGNQVMVDRISRPLGPSGFDSLYIGRGGALSGGIHFFDGIIDDVRIYKSCLSSKDVYEIYLEGLPPESNPPTTPEILSATAVSEFQINLTWSESEDESGIAEYLIFRNDSLIAQIKGQSYSDSNLLEYETYAYVIVAVDNFGNRSEDSPEVTVTTLDITAPSVPQNLISTNVTGSQIELFWFSSTDNDGIAGYNLYRNDTILIQVEDTSYSDTSVNDATSYIYKVQAIDNSGNESGFSNEVTETTLDVTAPSVPQNLSGSAISGNQINLEWDASTDNVGVTGYNIYRDNEMITTINGTNYSDIGLMPNTEYFYQVSASDEAGNESDLSVAITVTTLDVTEINEMNYAEFNKLYPNPANSEIIIELGTNQIINFELFDLCGIKIIEQEIYPGNNNINISTLINGMYIYKIFYGNENYKHGTLILSHD